MVRLERVSLVEIGHETQGKVRTVFVVLLITGKAALTIWVF
jgi:hypothetical protein